MKSLISFPTLAVVVLLAGCATNGASINPSISQANLANDKMQFAVGTANIGFDGAVGLNVVATFRQPNGLSAVLLDTPTITGPASLTVPNNGSNGNDAGTNHISGSPQVGPGQQAAPTTLGTSGGAFSYGFGPFNSSEQGTAFYPGNPPLYNQPFFSSTGGVSIAGGPPAYPFFNDGSFPFGFQGYSQGFTAFELTPVLGAYSLAVNVPTANAPSTTFNATASLSSLSVLPLPTGVTLAEDGTGGGTVSVTVPAGSTVETMVYVNDLSTNLFFTVGPLAGTGSLSGPLPDNLGACIPVGCHSTQSLSTGDSYIIYAISYDYPAFESGPPGDLSQTPTIAGASGQADIAISNIGSATYLVGRHASNYRPHRRH